MNDIDREIDLKDLCKSILYKWRTILLSLFIGLVLASVAALVSLPDQSEADTTSFDVHVDENTLQERLNDFDDISMEQQVKISEAIHLYSRWQVYRQYADKIDDIYHNDYINTPIEVLQLIVKTDSSSNADYDISSILGQELYNYIGDGGFAYDIVQSGATDLSSGLLTELISIRYDNLMTNYTIQLAGASNDSIDLARLALQNNPVISYTIQCKSAKDIPSSEIAELLISQIDTLEKKYASLGDYEIKLINRYNLTNYDVDGADKFNDAHEKEDSSYTQLEKYVNSLKDSEKEIFYQIMGLSTEKTSGFKYVLLIFVCVPLLYVMYAVLLYLFSDTIKTSDEFESYYNVKLLGDIKDNEAKKRWGAWVDKLLDKIFLRKQAELTKREELLVATITAICHQSETNTIHFASVTDYDSVTDSLKRVLDTLKNDGFSIVLDNNIVNSSDFIANTNDKQVILTERLGQCTNHDFMKGCSICKNNNSTVLGIILI